MSTINQGALNNARQLLRCSLGDVMDLPEDLRNSVVNTYYKLCCLEFELNQGPHHHPCYYRATNTVKPSGDYMAGVEKFYKELAQLKAFVDNLPTIINGIREMKKDGAMQGYKLCVSVALDTFKYRIPNAINKSSLRLSLERPFYAPKVREIPGLWKLL